MSDKTKLILKVVITVAIAALTALGAALGLTSCKVKRKVTTEASYFQRGDTTVNMSAATRLNMALMGGTGALVGSLLSDKKSVIYQSCSALVPKGVTLRGFLSPIIRAGLSAKEASFVIGSGVKIVNPWISSATPNVPVTQTILDKFASELS